MTSPAERYEAARRRSAEAGERPAFAEFTAQLDFSLDDFQREACQALERGTGVLVCAPTGAGKTVVGEFAVHLALRTGLKCFYTTPIKALSNQKFHDLVERYGPERVGLLTGDNSINGDAPVVVMTTEVLRNMLYAGSPTLQGLSYVVMDEVHYLADRFRGAVWEEVIIHLPESVTLVSLSATVSNAEEFADWLVTVRGETAVVVSEHRPVPLWQHMLVGKRMFDLFHDAEAAQKHDVHPELLRHTREMLRRLEMSGDGFGRPAGGRSGRGRRWMGARRPDVVERLDREGLLPAIVFIFSRAGCDAAVQQCLHAGLRLTSPDERAEIRPLVEEHTKHIPSEDLQVLGYWEWLDGLERGLAAHHAGMLPAFKEVVEELFVRGLVKAVFATETLALGINMPARCVVLERLVKFNGEAHVDLTPGEYTQLTGRAGRRGIDIEGHAVVVWAPEVDPRHVAGLASTRTYPLQSSFRPSYNMAVNLVGTVGVGRRPGPARELVRAVPGRPVGGRAGPAGAAQRRDHADVRAGDDLPPRRLRGVLRPARRHRRPGAGAGPAGRRATPLGRPGLAGAAADRRRHPGAVRPPRRPGGRHRVGGWQRLRRAPAAGADRGPVGRPAGGHRLHQPGRVAGPRAGAQALQPPLPAGAPRPRRPAAQHRRRPRRAAHAGPATRPPPTTPSWRRCAPGCAGTPATSARSGRSTPAGPSGAGACSATPRRCAARWPAAPVRWPARSTGSARCSSTAAI